jgi:hypothetical protein
MSIKDDGSRLVVLTTMDTDNPKKTNHKWDIDKEKERPTTAAHCAYEEKQ